jgi:hypothetical protein
VLGYEEDCAFALLWALGRVDALPESKGDASAYHDEVVRVRLLLFERPKDVGALVALARVRGLAEIAEEIGYLAGYQAIHATACPGWTVGGPGKWIGPLSPENVTCRLAALRWAMGG